MIAVTTKEARDQFAELVNPAAYGNKRVIIIRRGKKLAIVPGMVAMVPAMIPVEALGDLFMLEVPQNGIDLRPARKAAAEENELPVIPWPKIKSDLGL
jgi:hypothetical protein